jgi:6-phosphogluconolactonase
MIGFATRGVNFPRNVAIEPSGKWLYVANQKSTIVQFEINPQTGELKPTDEVTSSAAPVAIVFRTAGWRG